MTTVAIRTPLTSVIDSLTTPIVLGAMANVSGGSLAGQVSKAGGLGFIGAGSLDASRLQAEIDTAHKILGVNAQNQQRVHLGIGFLVWRLSSMHGASPSSSDISTHPISKDASPAMQVIDASLRSRPRAIWLSFGEKSDIATWASIIRAREAALNNNDEAAAKELKLFIGVGNVTQARAAVEDCGADVVIVQGNEAGGHGLGASPPLSVALSQVSSLMSQWKPSNPSGVLPPILAAGGIMNGSQLAGVLAQGAAGAVFGTRFLLTPEALYHDAQKDVLLKASGDATIRSMAFDDARNTLSWPEGVDGRGVVNDTVHDFHAADKTGSIESGAEQRRERYKLAEKEKDASRIITWAGTGVGLGTRILPAEEVVQEISQEAADAIRRSASYVTTA